MRKRACWASVAALMLIVVACGFPRPSDVAAGAPSGDTPFLSCIELPATCGTNGSEGCCTSLEVPGGSYDRSYDVAGDSNSGSPAYPATVSSFRLDKFEVTVGRFSGVRERWAGDPGAASGPRRGGTRNHPREWVEGRMERHAGG
jgi:formylglycine-generating enzyme required for sulfatase activity